MMTSSRPLGDVGGSFASRRGHSSQLSISDPSHHVTEAIGTLYGDEDEYYNSEHRPLSIVTAHGQEMQYRQAHEPHASSARDDPRRHLTRSASEQGAAAQAPPPNGHQQGHGSIKKAQTLPARMSTQRQNSFERAGSGSPLSPTMSLREIEAEQSQFPLTNIDNPNDIAQELSNLQALRRLSMDVGNNADPDMPPFSAMSLMAMPSIAPKGDDDENDPSRLLWVPARVHPELAPSEFKSFLENRVQSIKRRSGDSFLSTDGSSIDRSDSGGLRRKKSMLSRQIDNSDVRGSGSYVDGADRLEHKRTSSGTSGPELSLDELVKDPTMAVKKLAQDTKRMDGDVSAQEVDMPILPVAPGMGLRRSTRTTYRKGGSLRSGERLPFSKRVAAARQEAASASASATSPSGEATESSISQPLDAPKGHTLARVQSEPITENYSRPTRSVRRQQKFSAESPAPSSLDTAGAEAAEPRSSSPTRTFSDSLPIRTSSMDAGKPSQSVPQIVETPAPEDQLDGGHEQSRPFPQRSSSQKGAAQAAPPHQGQHAQQPYQQPYGSQQPSQPTFDEPPARSSKRPSPGRTNQKSPPPQPQPQSQAQPQPQPQPQTQGPHSQTVNDMASSPSSIPGGGASRTDTLTFIPTLQEGDKKEKKGRRERDDETSSIASSKSTSAWNWLRGSSDNKEKKKNRDEEKRSKSKSTEKPQDNVRLDVLSTFENAVAKSRESLLLDRESIDNKLHEERKKESGKKGESKKEKDGSIFSSLFAVGKKKGDRESSSKKQHLRVEEQPYRPLRPDVDYNWTRFPLLEERAIYRMAHIKLANPRRSLQSQVLLSNFMYSYLAIVQAMHPQMNVPVSPQQRRLEEEQRRKEREAAELAERELREQAMHEEQEHYGQEEYGRGGGEYGDEESNGRVDYVDDAQIYQADHGDHNDAGRDEYGYGHGQGHDEYGDRYREGKEYYSYDQEEDDDRYNGRNGW